MAGMSEEAILKVWENATEYMESWEEVIEELLDRIADLELSASGHEEFLEELEELKSNLISLKEEIDETAQKAKEGEINAEELEEYFRDFGETLSGYEADVMNLEAELPEEDLLEEEPEKDEEEEW